VGFVGVDHIAGVAVEGQAVQDRAEVVLVEPARGGGQAEGLVDQLPVTGTRLLRDLRRQLLDPPTPIRRHTNQVHQPAADAA
jgi:hypothetical protein